MPRQDSNLQPANHKSIALPITPLCGEINKLNVAFTTLHHIVIISQQYHCHLEMCDAAALLTGLWTCNSQGARSSPGWAPLHSGLGQATYISFPLSLTSIIWYRPRDTGTVMLFSWEGNHGPGEKQWQPTSGLMTKPSAG